ncbi:MAG: hypothetical protein BWK73_09110 [Thiothrix lacustris]|uniref:Uncharacterized protein n=1 Tax=Thiothrix lacustris TaxID=525917 RepID=A0A1Y1QV37_9GAMM|nr:MAG: hypothetical protein BWK73_09110 [Thiothrix lacustris]
MSAPHYYSRANLRALLQKKRIIKDKLGFRVVTVESESYQYTSALILSLESVAEHIGWLTCGSGNSKQYAGKVVQRLFRLSPPVIH